MFKNKVNFVVRLKDKMPMKGEIVSFDNSHVLLSIDINNNVHGQTQMSHGSFRAYVRAKIIRFVAA